MSEKFSTTSSLLFKENNNNNDNLPDWMKDLDIDLQKQANKNKNIPDLPTKEEGVFASEKQKINRDSKNGTPRQMEASLSNGRMVTGAKINLATFLSGKYYKVQPDINGNQIHLKTKIEEIPAKFNFKFTASSGKIKKAQTFSVFFNNETAEYPFSKAGFDECIDDINNEDIKSVEGEVGEGVNKTYLISKEEIVRRFNGELRKATDKINELLENDMIVGVGSNTFASLYNVDQLFPNEPKEKPQQKEGSFDFAPNREHVAAKPHKTANVLSIEASKMLSNFFSDFAIKNHFREGKELFIEASVLSNNGVKRTCNFCFGIDNEKVKSLKVAELNGERMTVEQLLSKLNINNSVLDKYLTKNNSNSKRIYQGRVLTARRIKNKLLGIVKKQNIKDIIHNWTDRDLITKINSTTYTTQHSFEELLANIEVDTLSNKEQQEIKAYKKKFGEGLDMNRNDVEDTGVRDYDQVKPSRELRLANLKQFLSTKFKNFKIENFINDNGIKEAKIIIKQGYKLDTCEADLYFINPENGVKNKVKAKAYFYKNHIDNVLVQLGNKQVSIDKARTLFKQSELLSNYLEDNSINKTAGSIIITENKIKDKLSNYVNNEEIDNIINEWYNEGYIKEINSGIYASNYSFENLLNKTEAQLLSNKDRTEIKLAKQYFGEQIKIGRKEIDDTGVREANEKLSNVNVLNKVNKFLSKHFDNFKPQDFEVNGENVTYTINLFDEETGLSTNIDFDFIINDNEITNCLANLNGEQIKINNIKRAFSTNEILNKYLNQNNNKKTNAPMIITTKQLQGKLNKIANIPLQEIKQMVNKWHKTGKIKKMGSNVFASNYTLEQLLSMSNIRPLSDKEIAQRINKSKRDRGLEVNAQHINDQDTRQPIEQWSSQRMVTHAKSELNKIFEDYNILDAKVNNDSYVITARVVNPNNGINQKLYCKLKVLGDKLGKLIAISDGKNTVSPDQLSKLDVSNEALREFNNINKATKRNYKNVISKRKLNNKLMAVIDNNKINDIVKHLVKNSVLKPLNTNKFASDYSLNEIVAYLDKSSKTNLNAGKKQQQYAQRDESKLKIDYRVNKDDNSRQIESKEEKLHSNMIKVCSKIKNKAKEACKKKIITKNKLEQLELQLDNAKNKKDIDKVWKELKRYFK
jgi:hypothetical protein